MIGVTKNILIYIGASVFSAATIVGAGNGVQSHTAESASGRIVGDTGKKKEEERDQRQPNYTPKDRYGDPYSNHQSKSPLLLGNPSNVKTEVTMDSVQGTYTIQEKVGETEYRPASTMTYEEYMQHQEKTMLRNYWKYKSGGGDSLRNKKDASEASLKIPAPGLGTIFGKDFVEIKPNGAVTLDFAGRWQRTENPNIPVRQQRMGGFEFDQQISMNVIGQIGDKLKLTANWDTKASFDFQNNLKLEYTGYEEDMLQKVEAGNVSFPVRSSLYSGSQNLFGIKTQMRMGRLFITSVMSSQRGKQEEMKIEGGSQSRDFTIRADSYDEYRHFFLGHFFRKNYEPSLRSLPTVTSGVQITRVDVYVTNRNNNTKDTRSIIAYLDLGESDTTLYRDRYDLGKGFEPTKNEANSLYSKVKDLKDLEVITGDLAAENLQNGTDYVVLNNARKLTEKDFKFHPELGYISLNTPIRRDELLAVAYEYTYNGKVFKVGEMQENIDSEDSDSTVGNVKPVLLKMISPNTVKTDLPTWDLMMKNVYQLGASQISRENFKLNIIYRNDESGADLPFLQEGQKTNRVLLLRLTGLDRLGPNLDPPGDGNFDFIEGVTVDSRYGRVIFPVLEPLGKNMEKYFIPEQEDALIHKYVFRELYDSTVAGMLNYASKNKYFITGRYQSSSGSEFWLNGMNIAPGSVVVMAGSRPLVEGTDYQIDYNMGRLRIINQGVLDAGQPITVRFEKSDLFSFRRKSFLGNRFDYRFNKDFNIGATILHQAEAPQISRVSIGDEPSKNTLVGLDLTYTKQSRMLTKLVDKLPIIQTKAPSTFSFQGEAAGLFPGHSRAVNKGDENDKGGVSYIDDFEGAETPFDLTRTPIKWVVGATPRRFPESNELGLEYSYRRARLAWYTVDQTVFYRSGGVNKPAHIDDEAIKNHFVRQVQAQEVFPNRDQFAVNFGEPVLNLAYYPEERGPYNFNPDLNTDGKLSNPSENWAGVTRAITSDIDFDNANVQYLEFWMMSPYIPNSKYTEIEPGQKFDLSNNGKLYFNLGSVSEDVMKDNQHAFENGLPVTEAEMNDESLVLENEWGKVTKKTFLTNAFENTEGARVKQDIGLDGLNSQEEVNHFDEAFISRLTGVSGSAYEAIVNDPAADDFKHYLGPDHDAAQATILQRYKKFNGMEGNSPQNTGEGSFIPSSSTYPDNEDLNQDNAINDLEEYYEYEIDIDQSKFVVGENYIVDKQVVTNPDFAHGDEVVWYQFRIPIREPDSTIGNIQGFKSLKFLRMYMTGFETPVVLRLVQMQLVANQWRVYTNDLYDKKPKQPTQEPAKANVVVSTVNIEENGLGDSETPPYTTPPGFTRDQDITSQNPRRLNEQSLQVCVENLPDGESEAVFKYVNFDLLNYKRMKMFIHAQSKESVPDSAVTAFVRIGTDFEENYYEIEIPLVYTRPPFSQNMADVEIWRAENKLDVSLEDLVDVKLERNASGISLRERFKGERAGRKIYVTGNPDMSAVQTIMIGLRNPVGGKAVRPIQTCIWADELLVSDFVEKPGYAATAVMNVQLADLATVSASVRYNTPGFGSLDQKVSQRTRDNNLQYGIGSNIALDKFLPEKLGLKLPLYVSHDKTIIAPKYDPLDPDVLLTESVANIPESGRDSYKAKIMDQTTTNSFNLTNVRKVKTKPGAKKHIYDIENLALSFGYTHKQRTNANIQEYDFKYWKAGIGYTYNMSGKSYEPFKKVKWLKSKHLTLIRDFNFSPLPSSITFRSDFDRRLTKTVYYAGNPRFDLLQDPLYEKSFTTNRTYGMNWNLTKSLTVDYKASVFGVIDEPDSLTPGTTEYRDSLFYEMKKLGRKKNFGQDIAVNYKLPLDKIPMLDWLGADTRYTAGYGWTAGARDLQDTLGNYISNKQDISVNGRINLEKLYNKNKFLRSINTPPAPVRRGPPLPGKTAEKKDTTEKKREYKAFKAGLRALMSAKMFNVTYSFNRGTSLAGYLPGVDYLGMSEFNTEMLPFIVGSQDASVRNIMADNGWLSRSRMLNTPFIQTNARTLNLRTALEPIRDLRIQIDAAENKTSNYQELFRIDSMGEDFTSEAPLRTGNYTASFISIKTAFSGRSVADDPNSSQVFDMFQAYRRDIRSQLNEAAGQDTLYSLNSQDVLIPAFLAAYSGKDISKAKTSPFPAIPLPNWRIDYTGLTKIKKLAKKFSAISITHGYQSKYTISGYSSSLSYDKTVINPDNDVEDGIDPKNIVKNENGRAIPAYLIDQVTITEQFAPLIGINVRTRTKFTAKLDFTKDRTIALSMSNAQVQEISNTGITIGIGYGKTGMKLPFAVGGNPEYRLKNEITFRVDFSIRDGKTVQRKLDEGSTTTAGNLNWQLKPTINYVVNQRLNLNFYFERTVNEPKISSSFRRTTTAFGVQLRFTLS